VLGSAGTEFTPLRLSILTGEGVEATDGVVVSSLGELANALGSLAASAESDAWIWVRDPKVTAEDRAAALVRGRTAVDVFHGGLAVGTAGLLRLLLFTHPTWMLRADAPPNMVSTSWRVSWQACLLRAEVVRQLGPPAHWLETAQAAALEWGLRCLRAGAIVRYDPKLVNPDVPSSAGVPTAKDEARIIANHFGRRWAMWALARSWWTGRLPARAGWGALKACYLLRMNDSGKPRAFERTTLPLADSPAESVSVVIPTLDRYSYLDTLLDQLQAQTVPPLEVIVVDQTPSGRRRTDFSPRFPKLNLRWLTMDDPGQCRSRNLALLHARGDWVLFLDDDVEVPPSYIERHLQVAVQTGADVVSGTVLEPPTFAPPAGVGKTSVSAVFPTGTSLVRREALVRSGGFDLVYDHGQRADGDLGMRLYLSGALMLLDSANCILHHHAPRGGLRAHRRRAITAATARQSIWRRALPSAWDFYLALRYFGADAAREMAHVAVLSTFVARGGAARRLGRVLVALVLLPSTWRRVDNASKGGAALYSTGPQIPPLPPGRVEGNHEAP